MISIENLYFELHHQEIYSPDKVIEFYDKNSILLNNISTFKNEIELGYYIEIVWQYFNALYIKSRYNKIIDKAEKSLLKIDLHLEKFGSEQFKKDWYYGIISFKGMACFYLKDYKTSSSIFKDLIKIDTENENYKNWLLQSSYHLNNWKITFVEIICSILLFIEIIFNESIDNYYISMAMLCTGILGIIGCSIYKQFINRKQRIKS